MRASQPKSIAGLAIGLISLLPMWYLVGFVGLFGHDLWAFVTVWSLRAGLLLGPLAYGYEVARPEMTQPPPPLARRDADLVDAAGASVSTVGVVDRATVDKTRAGAWHQEPKSDALVRSFIPTAKVLWRISFAVAAVVAALAVLAVLFLAWAFGAAI